MVRKLILPMVIVVLFSGTSFADPDIRDVDFRNFTYRPMICNKEYGKEGVGKSVKLRNGDFQNKGVSYGTVVVLFGDLTRDGRAEAVIHNVCEVGGSTSSVLSEIFVYTMNNGKPELLAATDDDDMEGAYSRYGDRGSVWGITDNGITVKGGELSVERYFGSAHCCPESILTLVYRVDGGKLVLARKPSKRPFKQ